TIEPIDAAAELRPRGRQRRWIALERARLEAHDLRNLVDQQRIKFTALFGDNRHTRLICGGGRQAQTLAEVNGGHDATAQIEATGNFGGGQWDASYFVLTQNVPHSQNRDTAKLIGDRQYDECPFFLIVRCGGAFQDVGCHAWSLRYGP